MIDLVPLFGIVFIFGAPVAAWIISRVLAHQERMEMIRHGIVPPLDPRAMRNAARSGWQPGPMPPPPPPNMGFGAPPPPPMAGYHDGFYAQTQLRKGITVTAVGFALLIGLSFIRLGEPGPWLLGGLIPMFVGIAQVINAVLNGARLPGMGMQGGQTSFSAGPPPPQPPPAPGPGPGPDLGAQPYAWRPGATTPIEKPAPPPDQR